MIATRVLVTGFEPFDGESVNPSMALIELLPELVLDAAHAQGLLLPVERARAHEVLFAAIDTFEPSVVLMFGEAGGRAQITPERVAINLDDYNIADNAGQQPRGEAIVIDGPVGYFSTLPIPSIIDAIHAQGVPAQISNSAGTYLCNRVFYHAMHHLAQSDRATIAGFIHLPYLPEQVIDKGNEMPSMSLANMSSALQAIINSCVSSSNDSH